MKEDYSIDPRDIFIKGKNVFLKVLTRDDVIHSNWYGWFNDEETSIHLQKHYYPNTLENQLEFFESLVSNRSKIQLGIISSKTQDKLIGIISLQGINSINRNAELSMIVGDQEHRGLVVAEESMRLMLNHGFNTLNLHKIHIGYLEALKPWGMFLQKQMNFKVEGELKEHVFKNGKFVNVELASVFADDFNHKFSRKM